MNKNNWLKLFLIFLFLFSFILRLWDLENRMAFSTDQGIDMLKIWEKTHQKELYFLGPKASVARFHMGPFYYYWLTPAVVLGRFHPLSPAVFVALIESFTPVIIFLFAKRFFNKPAAFYASLLYAVSPLAITFASFAWNPNTIPFFVMLILFFLFAYIKEKQERNFIIAALIYFFAFQLHYQMTIIGLLFPVAFLLKPLKNLKSYLLIFLGLCFSFMPYFIFELRNNFYNFKAIYSFLTENHSQYYNRVGNIEFLSRFLPDFYAKTAGGYNFALGLIIFTVTMVFLFVLVFKNLLFKQKNIKNSLNLWFIFNFLCLLGLRIYKGDKLDYYLAFMFILPVVSLGIVLGKIDFLLKQKKFGPTINFMVFPFIFLFSLNLLKTPIFTQASPTSSYHEAKDLAAKILELAENRKYALEINSRFYNPPTRYLLTYWNKKPVSSAEAEVAIRVCHPGKDCSDMNDNNKKDVPPQLFDKIDESVFSEKTKSFVVSDFYFIVYEKK